MERGDVYRTWRPGQGVYLNLNESPAELPENLKRMILERLGELSWCRYPDASMTDCRRTIASWFGLDEDWVLLGNGSNELLETVMLALSPPGGRIAWVCPGFSMVPRLAELLHRKLVRQNLSEKDFSFEDFSMSTALHGVDMVLLASPNNPSGTCLPRDLLERLMSAYAGPVVIDEAYAEFSGTSFTDCLDRFSNLVILRTFSKAYRLAGARIGYALARPGLIEQLRAHQPPFSVGLFQQACIESLGRTRSFLDEAVKAVCRQREIVRDGLRALEGFTVIDSQANFLLFSPGPGRGQSLFQWLKQKGIWLRDFRESGLRDWLRVTVGNDEENKLFLGMVSAWYGELLR